MKHDETTRPAAVPGTDPGSTLTKQAGQYPNPWFWVQHGAWTERMRTRLANSEPTTVWYALWDKVTSPENLQTAYWSVWRNGGAAGVDGQTVAQFNEQEQAELAKLREELRTKTYRRKPARRVWIDKPGSQEKRPLGIPAVRDRTVEAAIKQVLEPIFEHDFAQHSYGFRPGRGCRDAVQHVEKLLNEGRTWCVDLDFKSYFDTIAHDRLLAKMRRRVADGSVLALLEQSLKAGVMEELNGWQPTETGTPQGSVISPMLANLYLNDLDHLMAQHGWEIIRYADDLVVLCPSKEEAERALAFIRQWSQEAGLTVHPTKTRIVNVLTEGFDFLGWHFRGHKKWPRKKSLQKLQERLRPFSQRSSGKSLGEIIYKVNPILRGWYGYFRDSHPTGLSGPDGWLRRRLRSLLRKRKKRPGFGRSKADSQRWPNKWFAARGLFSLEAGSCTYG